MDILRPGDLVQALKTQRGFTQGQTYKMVTSGDFSHPVLGVKNDRGEFFHSQGLVFIKTFGTYDQMITFRRKL